MDPEPEFCCMSPGSEVVVVVVVEVVVVRGVVDDVVVVLVVVAGVVVVVVAGVVVVVVVFDVVVVVVAGVVVVVVVVASATCSHVPLTYSLIPAASALQLLSYVEASDPQTGEYSSVQEAQTLTTSLHPPSTVPQQASAVSKKKIS